MPIQVIELAILFNWGLAFIWAFVIGYFMAEAETLKPSAPIPVIIFLMVLSAVVGMISGPVAAVYIIGSGADWVFITLLLMSVIDFLILLTVSYNQKIQSRRGH